MRTVNEASAKIIQAQFAKQTKTPMTITRWKQGEPLESGAG